ncbi:ROK family protein [Chloroflexota bacterium]
MAKNKTPYIGIDLGGTKILVAVVSHKGKILSRAKNPTPGKEGPDAVIEQIVRTVKQAAKKADLSLDKVGAVGIGSPGVVEAHTGIVRFAPNLSYWAEVPLGSALEKAFKRPVVVGNDVDVSTYGEYALGAGAGCNSMAGIFPGTGIGGALILDGKLHTGARGSAAEIGHIVLQADGPLCGCGRRGCVEAIASRTAIERDLWASIQFGRETMLTDLVQPGERIRSGILAQAAAAGDMLVLETLMRTGHYLGLLAGSVANLIDPEVIVFGGGLIEACDVWLMPVIRGTAQEYFINRLDIDKVRIEEASLGDYAGVLGAAMLARSTHG